MARLILILFLLAGCGVTPPVVVPNTQAGQTNSQTIGQTQMVNQTVRQAEVVRQSADENRVRVERVETIVQNEGPNPWWIIALIVAVLVDSPLRWPGQLYRAFTGKRDID